MRSLPECERYQAIDRLMPAFILDEHPDGAHLALMAVSSPHNRAAGWERRSGRIVWRTRATQALCWLPGGEQRPRLWHTARKPHPRSSANRLGTSGGGWGDLESISQSETPASSARRSSPSTAQWTPPPTVRRRRVA